MAEFEELLDFRPRMGSRSGRASERRSPSLRNEVLAAMRGAGRRLTRQHAPIRSRVAVRPPSELARRVIIKAHYTRMTASGAKAAALHLRYIERDGVEKDGSKGVLYSEDGPARVEAFEQPRRGEEHQFRLIVSPEDGDELDLTSYVRRLMASMQRDLGQRLEWGAVNHHDTDHPHAHIVIRGVDRDGCEVRLDRGYISHGLRRRAQELATEELGPRNELEIRRSHAREVTLDRFTSLDRELDRRAKDSHVSARSALRPGGVDESMLLARLRHLEGLGFAERTGPTAWSLTPDWQNQLRELATRGDILKQIHRAVSGDPTSYRVVRAGEALETEDASASGITGRVASKGLSDELKGGFYAVVDTPSGKAYHVAIDRRAAEELQTGDIVSMISKPVPLVQPVDREIAKVAESASGTYVLNSTSAHGTHAHAVRLQSLERLGLAKPEGPDRWKIAANLLQELEHRGAATRHRLVLRKQPPLAEQVQRAGPVWLDRIKVETLPKFGFGADLRHAIRQRRQVLDQLGIRAHDGKRFAELSELERRQLGERVATATLQKFLRDGPQGFQGRVQAAPEDRRYIVISDGKHFVVLSASREMRALVGKTVTLSCDARQRPVLRAVDKDLDR